MVGCDGWAARSGGWVTHMSAGPRGAYSRNGGRCRRWSSSTRSAMLRQEAFLAGASTVTRRRSPDTADHCARRTFAMDRRLTAWLAAPVHSPRVLSTSTRRERSSASCAVTLVATPGPREAGATGADTRVRTSTAVHARHRDCRRRHQQDRSNRRSVSTPALRRACIAVRAGWRRTAQAFQSITCYLLAFHAAPRCHEKATRTIEA